MSITLLSFLLHQGRWRAAVTAPCLAAVLGVLSWTPVGMAQTPATPTAAPTSQTFRMVRSTAAVNAKCLVGAKADVKVEKLGPVEKMTIVATGLPKNTDFDLFVIQVPDAPFGLAWYQGDLESNVNGVARGTFIGRFNIETFIVAPAPGGAPAPVVHDDPPFPDADTNPATPPVHTFHLGLWFNSPNDAAAAKCPDTVTPFNGDHTAGIQALSTRLFPVDRGPLRRLH